MRGIPEYAYMKSMESMGKTDLVIIIGTTGEVMPAASLPQIAKLKGAKIIEINTEKSSFTHSVTDIFLQGKAAEVSAELKRLLPRRIGQHKSYIHKKQKKRDLRLS